MPSSTLAAGPFVESGRIVFSYADPRRALTRVRLAHELARPRRHDFERRGRVWELRFPLPEADRIEYLLELTHAGGGTELRCDPENPLRAPGPFGDKSVVELDGYEPPAWLASEPEPGRVEPLELRSGVLRASLGGLLWTSPGAGSAERLPLLVAHDGPEYAEYSSLLLYLEAMTEAGRLPPLRAALLAPVDRDQTYSASAVYARALARDLLPALPADRRLPVVGMGASLGALALLHAHRAYPGVLGGLFLQSGSYFRQRSDRQESGFVRFRRISRFVGQVLGAETWDDPVPVALTCGTAEENLANNRAVARALAAQGYGVRVHAQRDAHTWICWRDSFDPLLADLLGRLWG